MPMPVSATASSIQSLRRKLPAARMAPGGSRTALRLTSLYPLAPWGPLAWLPSRCRGLLNPPNRRIRTRTSGGVGGEEPRAPPLSRSSRPDETGSPRCATKALDQKIYEDLHLGRLMTAGRQQSVQRVDLRILCVL